VDWLIIYSKIGSTKIGVVLVEANSSVCVDSRADEGRKVGKNVVHTM